MKENEKLPSVVEVVDFNGRKWLIESGDVLLKLTYADTPFVLDGSEYRDVLIQNTGDDLVTAMTGLIQETSTLNIMLAFKISKVLSEMNTSYQN